MKHRYPAALLLLMLWGSLAVAEDRVKITAPSPISKVYSEADMRLQLATIPDIKTVCKEDECILESLFDDRVQQLGVRLAIAAFEAYPQLIKKFSGFEFDVAEKAQPGITSSASGTVIIFRGTQFLELEEPALAFLMAREMGHIISEHHEENSATKIMLSVAAGILFPALHLFSGTATAAQATSSVTSSTTLAATAASTATTYVGSKLMLANLKPDQANEADKVALNLLEKLGWGVHDISVAIENSKNTYGESAWAEDLRQSVGHIRTMDSIAQSVEFNLTDTGFVTPIESDNQAAAAQDPLITPDETPLVKTETSDHTDVPLAEPAQSEMPMAEAPSPIAEVNETVSPVPPETNVVVQGNEVSAEHQIESGELPIKLQASSLLGQTVINKGKNKIAGISIRLTKNQGKSRTNSLKKKPAMAPKKKALAKAKPARSAMQENKKVVNPAQRPAKPMRTKPGTKTKKTSD